MLNNLKDINLVQCTGRILFKRYNEERGTLTLVQSIYAPKWAAGSDGQQTTKDYPTYYIEGEMAKKYNEMVQQDKFYTIIGHAGLRDFFVHERDENGHRSRNNSYRRVMEPCTFVDAIYEDYGHENINMLLLEGEITNIRKGNSKAWFLMMSTKAGGADIRTSVTCFDLDMEKENGLNPKVGDRALIHGAFRTRTVETQKIHSFVARSISLQRIEQKG